MNQADGNSLELFDLIESVYRGEFAPSELIDLQQRVKVDAEARRAYVLYANMSARLRRMSARSMLTGSQNAADRAEESDFVLASIERFDDPLGRAGSILENEDTTAIDACPSSLSRGQQQRFWLDELLHKRAFHVSLGMAAVAVLICLAVMATLRQGQIAGNPAVPPAIDPLAAPYIVKIRGVHNAQWGPTSSTVELNNPLNTGDFYLERGMVDLAFSSGASVLIEGPASFQIRKPNEIAFDRGKLVARVPRAAQGFSVYTPLVDIVDLGTQFGVVADGNESCEVHVFSGKVNVQATDRYGVESNDDTPSQSHPLTAGQAMRFEQAQGAPSVLPADGLLFARSFPRGYNDRSVLAHWRFEHPLAAPFGVAEGTLREAVADDGGGKRPLSFWLGGFGDFQTSSDTPPASMFADGFSGGSGSFHSAALDSKAEGVLFYDSLEGDPALSFDSSFTLEGFFKSDGDRSAQGPMAILSHAVEVLHYAVELNETKPGALSFRVMLLVSNELVPITVAIDGHNYANGEWHYFAARFDRSVVSSPQMRLDVHSESGRRAHAVERVPHNSRPVQKRQDLYIGRSWHMLPPRGHFIGLIDEVRISGAARSNDQLMGKLISGDDEAAAAFQQEPKPK